MRGPGRVPLGGGRVVAVVAGQVEVAQVHAGIPAVQLELAERDLGGADEAGQLGLVVAVGQRRVGAGGAGQLAEAGRDAGPGQVLHPPVVLMPAAVLAGGGQLQVAQGAQPGGQVVHAVSHARNRTGWGRPALEDWPGGRGACAPATVAAC